MRVRRSGLIFTEGDEFGGTIRFGVYGALEGASEAMGLEGAARLALVRTRRQAPADGAIDPLRLLGEAVQGGAVPYPEELLEVVPSEQRGLMHRSRRARLRPGQRTAQRRDLRTALSGSPGSEEIEWP